MAKLSLVGVLCLPALSARMFDLSLGEVTALGVYALAIVSAAFVLAWAAEAAQKDISGALALALLALIAVLPEYAVDLYYAFRSGTEPAYAHFAAANMTGSNRLLLGFGWPIVVLLSIWVLRRYGGKIGTGTIKGLRLVGDQRLDIGYLLILACLALPIPLFGGIPVWYGLVLIFVFVLYLWQVSRQGPEAEPHLVGVPAQIASLSQRPRRILIVSLLAGSAAMILTVAEPFANALVASGEVLGIDSYFLVQWLAPLASEAPEFIIAILFALQGKGSFAIGTLISAKINQWSLLVGSLPLAHLAGGGSMQLDFDARQVEEFLLTASQTFLGVSLIITLSFHRWAAWTLAGLFALQFFITDVQGRYVLSAIQGLLALCMFIWHRKHIPSVLLAPWRDLQGESRHTQHRSTVRVD